MPKNNKFSRKVVFFFPSFASSEATAPLGVLAVATPLIRSGYQVILIDSTITPDYKKRVLEEVRDALCLGISLVTGPMIRETVEIARAVKEWNPDFPIVLGGWHPSLLPDQTCRLTVSTISCAARVKTHCWSWSGISSRGPHRISSQVSASNATVGLILTPERPLKPFGGYAAQGVPHRRLRCL